jgi:mono/diheme cytochrome c family protein
LGLLGVIAVALPLYWLAEPSRQENAVVMFEETFISRGADLYDEGANCAACHGPAGSGGSAATAQLNDRGEFVAQITWQAPALDTVLYRYSEEEVFDILMYGRPNTPMPAWGSEGGGPLTDQQLTDIVAYLRSVQLPAEEVRAAVDEEIENTCAPDDEGNCTLEDGEFATEGEAIFNMGLNTNFAGGAYSCGRCHTKGWSWGEPEVAGGGFLGPSLTGGATLRQFPSIQNMIDFISVGAERGQPYGVGGQADGGTMPGFGHNPNAVDPDTATMSEDQVMFTPEQIAAVVDYERSLP